ncbi:MAG: hypothetical protein JWO86_7675 [Myxococcaceae bacterium]|nr:hypothetical protein [Myxococcaceae bacterium]
MRRPTIRTHALVALLLAGATTLASVPASAQAQQASKEQVAEKLFNEAIAFVGAGKYAEACSKFEESQKLDPALGTEFNLADCYEHTGRKGSARRLFLEVADAAKAAGKSERERSSRERANALEAIAPRLTVVVLPSAAESRLEIVVDGAPFPAARWNHAQPIDAGAHTVATSAPGKKPFSTKVVLQDGKSVEVKIPELEDEPVPVVAGGEKVDTGSGQRRTGMVVAGIGVVGVLVGGGAGLFSLVKHGQAKDICPDFNACPDADGRSKWNAATDAGTVSTIAFIVGGMGLVAGGLLYFTAAKDSAASAASSGSGRSWWVTPSIGLGSAGLVAGGSL